MLRPTHQRVNVVPTLQVDGRTIAVIDHTTADKLVQASRRQIGKVRPTEGRRPPDSSPAEVGTDTPSTLAPAVTINLAVDFPYGD
jgi:hypothetical protein